MLPYEELKKLWRDEKNSTSNHYCNDCICTTRHLCVYNGEQVQKLVCGQCGREIVVVKYAKRTLSRQVADEFKDANSRRFWR